MAKAPHLTGRRASSGRGLPRLRRKRDAPRQGQDDPQAAPPRAQWTFLTNHTHVLICLARDSTQRLRDVAAHVGITERAVQKIVQDLEEAEVLTRSRVGRRNAYELHLDVPLRHPIAENVTLRDLLGIATR